jgi:hypothetical protein
MMKNNNEIKVMYSAFRSVIYITLISICWIIYIAAIIVEIRKGFNENFILGAIVAFMIFTVISFIIWKYALRFTLRRFVVDDESIRFKRKKEIVILPWDSVTRIYKSNKVPSYLTDHTDGYIIEYINNSILEQVHLISSRKVDDFIVFLNNTGIIHLE